jgi:hypothetical protein
VKKVRRTHWQDFSHENKTRGGRKAKGGAPGDLGNSSKESRSRVGGIGRAKAKTSSSEVRGTLWTNTRARDGGESTSHCAGIANWCGRTPARLN